MYAPKELTCSQYVIQNKCGWVATNKAELREVIYSVIHDEKRRIETLKRAGEVASNNHDLYQNASKFQQILQSV